MGHGKRNLLASVPGLSDLKAFAAVADRPDADKLIRYCALMYDKGSPLIKMHPDIESRKRDAAARAGYSVGECGPLFNLEDPHLTAMAIELCGAVSDRLWSQIVMYEQSLYEYRAIVLGGEVSLRGVDAKEKKIRLARRRELLADCDMIVRKLDEYYPRVFPEPEIAEAVNNSRAPVDSGGDSEEIVLTPESIADNV
jgi:hypothetical protein